MSYKSFDGDDLAFLRSICGGERVTARDAIGEDYCHDELGGAFARPDARVQVLSVEEISAVMRYAHEHCIPVTVRGSGTGLVGGAVPLEGGILLDTSGMTNVLELDERNMTLTVEPGVLLMDVAKYVEERGFFYPPDPGEKTATIGGNISTNAGGMRAVKYGVTRDYVRALTVVLPNGDVVELGGKIAKNSSGYSLKDLIVGSEGTLGIVARATLRLLPLPKARISLLVPFPDLEAAIREGIAELFEDGWTQEELMALSQDMGVREDVARGLDVVRAACKYLRAQMQAMKTVPRRRGVPVARMAGGMGAAMQDNRIEAMSDAQFEAFSRQAREAAMMGRKVRM